MYLCKRITTIRQSIFPVLRKGIAAPGFPLLCGVSSNGPADLQLFSQRRTEGRLPSIISDVDQRFPQDFPITDSLLPYQSTTRSTSFFCPLPARKATGTFCFFATEHFVCCFCYNFKPNPVISVIGNGNIQLCPS